MLPVSLEIVVQDRVVFVNGKAIHAQTVTSRFLSQRQDCDTVRSGVGAQRSGPEVTIADSLALFPSHRTNGRASVRSWCKNLGWHAQRPHQNREQVSQRTEPGSGCGYVILDLNLVSYNQRRFHPEARNCVLFTRMADALQES